jgi:hypothetical protein
MASFKAKRALYAASNKKACNKHDHPITGQHNYHDHASNICCNTNRMPAKGEVVTPFPLKLHAMLEAVEQDGLEDIMSWQPHGRCFVIHDQKALVNILVKHFNVAKVSSFQRHLNLYGFQFLTKGLDKGGYYHELFLRGKVFLSLNIQRIKVKGTKIRARLNPDQEPNFYAMPFVLRNGNNAHSVPSQEQDLEPCARSFANFSSLVGIGDDEQDVMQETEEAQAEAFFKDFDFPSDSIAFENIEDDDVFGKLLEHMSA